MKLPSTKVLAAALSLAFAGLPSQTTATHSWGGYHWARTSNPFTLKLGDNVSGAWESVLQTTSFDWSTNPTSFPTVLQTTIVPGKTTARRCKPTVGQVEVCNEKYGNTGWLGVAQIWISGTHITQGTTKLNDTYFSTAKYNTTAWRNLVSCQEVGHTFGLDHQDENFNNANLGTCMDYTNDPSTNQHPNTHDYEELSIIYQHIDSSTTVAQAAASAAALPAEWVDHDYNVRSQWGKLVRESKNGLKEVYVLDFGQGHKLVTFVRWAEGEGRGR
ncbi:MAG TPA: hypothetical protein VGP71_15280 [Burkholderiales bacterium]|jgi:hypothetical protein|nr:hypothetical protein [Burkholderiales bacterium]